LAARPAGLWTLKHWLIPGEHDLEWQATDQTRAAMQQWQEELDFKNGQRQHLHLYGETGVGKTRFAMEICRDALWKDHVIYFQKASDHRLNEIISDVVHAADVRLMLVVDQVETKDLQDLQQAIAKGQGRIRLITIGQEAGNDQQRIVSHQVKPLERQILEKIIEKWHGDMSHEVIDFIVRFAMGNVRFAWLLSNAIKRVPRQNITSLLREGDIRFFLNDFLGTGREALYVIAVLSHVGWSGDKAEQARAIARHFELPWHEVRAKIWHYQEKLGIITMTGRYCSISPAPLASYLAIEAWTRLSDELKSLPSILPVEAHDAYYQRLGQISSHPQAKAQARQALATIDNIQRFQEARLAERWYALVAADPLSEARRVAGLLKAASLEERLGIADEARRALVNGLVSLAWRSDCFDHAVTALALLAEAENEDWANNASGEFVARFQMYLGGTARPYLERLPVLDRLISNNEVVFIKLAIRALRQVADTSATRHHPEPSSDQAAEPEWNPSGPAENAEYIACVQAGIARLTSITEKGLAELESDLMGVATECQRLLVYPAALLATASVRQWFEVLLAHYPKSREKLRQIIAATNLQLKKLLPKPVFINKKPKTPFRSPIVKVKRLILQGELATSKVFYQKFVDHSIEGQLQEIVGGSSIHWSTPHQADLAPFQPLVDQFMADPTLLSQHWPWLTGGEAEDSWWFGQALAANDHTATLARQFASLPSGMALHLPCGYMEQQRQVKGDGWYEQWFAQQMQVQPPPVALLLAVGRSAGMTDAIAGQLTALLQQYSASAIGQLGSGHWNNAVSQPVLENLLTTILNLGADHNTAMLNVLNHRLKNHPNEVNAWQTLALRVIDTPHLISNHENSIIWSLVSKQFVSTHASVIATAIFGAKASSNWFFEESEAHYTLEACIKEDPSGVWQAMEPYLKNKNAFGFTIGLPKDIIGQLPIKDILTWAATDPQKHVPVLASLVDKDFSDDNGIGARLIGLYGDDERVADAFTGHYRTGEKLFECVQDASLEAGEHQSGHTGIDDGFTRFY
jgi:hypothetical protein